jgi:hypothetical protein
MNSKLMGLVCALVACLAAALLPLSWSARGTAVAQASLVQRVNPRPRLMFAPGEYARFLSETTGSRRGAFDRVTAEIDAQGARNWNERDLQVETQALAARVLLDRGDGRGAKYLGLARQSMRAVIERQAFHRFPDSHVLVTEGAQLVKAVALVHDWLYRFWTPDERSAMARWLQTEINEWVDTNRIGRASASPFRNDAARGTAAMVLAGLTLFDEPGLEGTGRKALGYALPHYNAILAAHTYAGAGGGLAEGTFYGNFTAWGQILATEALYTGAGIGDAYSRSPFFHARLRYATHAAWPGYLTNQFAFNVHQLAPVFGDARRGPTGSALYHRAIVLLLGKRFPGSAAAREAYWAVNRDETSRTYTREWALFDLLYWSPDVRREPPTALTYREPTLGQIFARSDWTDEATWISFNAGPHLDTHQHYDAGNLTIFRHVDLATDSGSLDNFGTNHWYNYYARTVAHNTITVTDPEEQWAAIWGGVPAARTVNDGGQRTAAPLTPAPTLDQYLANRTAYDHARIERYEDGGWGLYVRANLTNAYQNPQYQSAKPNGSRNRPKVTHVGREVVYLRRNEGRRDAVVVFDRVVATDPSFRKAVLWHAREPFESKDRGRRVDEGEERFSGSGRYDFQTLVRFKQGSRDAQARLFVTALAVDPIAVRAIGRRIHTDSVDHTTFGTAHHHRHVKDFFVQDPRNILNDSKTTGALGRPEWPPFGPPELTWLWNDDLTGGWGQSRLEIEPAGAPRAADRFLTVLVPSDAGEAARPRIERGSSVDGHGVGVAIRDGSRMDVVVFGSDPGGADLTATAVDVPAQPLNGDLIVATLTPGASYYIRAKTDGGVQRIAISQAPGGTVADAAGVIRVRLDAILRSRLGEPFPGHAAAASGATTASLSEIDLGLSADASATRSVAAARRASHPDLMVVNASAPSARDAWSRRIDEMVRSGELRQRDTIQDPQAPTRRREQLAQVHNGVPILGGALTREWEGDDVSAIFGTLYARVNVDTVPQLTPERAAQRIAQAFGAPVHRGQAPELIIVPTDDGRYRLAYRMRVMRDDAMMYFVDANTGEGVLAFSDLKRPAM